MIEVTERRVLGPFAGQFGIRSSFDVNPYHGATPNALAAHPIGAGLKKPGCSTGVAPISLTGIPRTSSTGSLRMGRYHASELANQSGVSPLARAVISAADKTRSHLAHSAK